MKRICILIITLVLSISVYAQKRAYLLHTDENISRLKEQIVKNEDVRNAWETQLEIANKLLERDRLGSADCQVLGLVYRMTSEAKYAESIKEILIDYTSRETWEGRDLLNRTPPWRGGLPTSHTSFYIAIGYDCVYDFLTKSERNKISKGFVKVGIAPLREDWIIPTTNFHTFDTMGHNWWSACVYMAGFASLAIRNEVPEAEVWAKEIEATSSEWFNYSGSILQNKIFTFDRNGGFWESINYASYGVSQYLLFRLALNNVMPKYKQSEIPVLDKMADFFISTTYYVETGKPLSVNFGDSSIRRNGNACVLLLWNLGFQQDRYAWYLNKVSKGTDKEGLQLNSPVGLLLYPEFEKLDKDYRPDISKSSIYPDMGWATLRNSWEDNATLLAVKSGFTWNHAHADAGSYILFHKGKNLIIDSGNSSYGNPLYTKYYCQSEAHNVVLWNGKGEEQNAPYFGSVNHASIHNLIDAGNLKYVLANATGPYSRILSRNYRSFLWIGDVILVVDDLLAYEPGKFEWLLHYNGESKRRGQNLSIKDGDAEVIVKPLFPETFPDGGLPHDFPEQMTLQQRWGWEDHHPENKIPYWSVSHPEKTARTKFVNAIILKDKETGNNLPQVERFEGKHFLGVRITQNGETTEVYLNLLADGSLKHRNSVVNMNGWDTDAYLMALTFKTGQDKSKIDNISNLFVTHGSYIRRNDQVLVHALSKYTANILDFNIAPKILFQGQKNIDFEFYSKSSSAIVNGEKQKGRYDSKLELVKLKMDLNN